MTTRSGATETLNTISAFSREGHVTLLVRCQGETRVEALARGQSLVVGRLAPSDIVVSSGKLSRQHARLSYGDAGPLVEDLGSRNGTLLRGKRVTRAVLHSGDVLLMGDVTLSVHVFEPSELVLAGVMGHGRFVALLEAEAVRTQVMGTHAALLLARDTQGRAVETLVAVVKARVRASDAVSLYSRDVLEVLLTDVDAEGERARSVADALSQAGVHSGGALLPGSAGTAQELIAQARDALADAVRHARPVLRELPGPGLAGSDDAGVVADSVSLKRLLELVGRVAQSPIPVLIFGETGTGKEVIARAIHRHSPRAKGPLCAVNCGALLPQLVDSTLFGNERGAFTGADRQRKGLFEEAHGGTLFLDEIGELPLVAQASLLRVLETKTLTRVGGTREIPVDVRIVAASHRRLESMCAQGTFRQDLLFRLNVMTLSVPPLREHPEDIDGLVQLFLERAAESSGKRVLAVSQAARALMYDYAWPGNVRELRNEVERAVVVCRGQSIQPEDLSDRLREQPSATDQLAVGATAPDAQPGAHTLPPEPASGNADPSQGQSLRDRMQAFERRVIVEALEHCGGNQTLAAKHLSMPRRTLVHKLKLYDIK